MLYTLLADCSIAHLNNTPSADSYTESADVVFGAASLASETAPVFCFSGLKSHEPDALLSAFGMRSESGLLLAVCKDCIGDVSIKCEDDI